MANTHALIASYTATNNTTNSYNFTSIPQTYTDLKLIISARGTMDSGNLKVRPNGLTSSYYQLNLTGYYTSDEGQNWSSSSSSWNYFYAQDASAGNYLGNAEAYIGKYTGSNYKSIQAYSLNASQNTTYMLNCYLNGSINTTDAITSLEVGWSNASQYFQTGSSVCLYGIKNS